MRAYELRQGKGTYQKVWSLMNPKGRWFKAYHKVGEHEGCGILLLIAKLDPRGSGHLEPEVVHRFFKDIESTAENVLGFATTLMVVSTLSLSVVVPLMLWPHNTASDVHNTASLGGGWPYTGDWISAWLSSNAMPVVGWCESLAFAASVYNSCVGTLIGMTVYTNLAIYAPDSESKMYWLFDNVDMLSRLLYRGMGGLLCLLFGLVYLAARVSPIACLALALGAAAIVHSFAFDPSFGYSMAIAPALNQLRIARDILSNNRDLATSTAIQHLQVEEAIS